MRVLFRLSVLFLLTNFSDDVSSGGRFLSSDYLMKTFRLERDLVRILKERKAQIEKSLELIGDYTRDVESLYRGEGVCWPLESCEIEEELSDRILGNPIYNYQVLRRLIVNWKNTEDALKQVNTKKILEEIKRLKNRYGGLPGNPDLQKAAAALNRIKKIYNLNVTRFSEGNILGLQTSAELNARDTLFLGRFAATDNHPDVAIQWLERAAFQVEFKDTALASVVNETFSDDQILKQVKLTLKQVRKKTSKNNDSSFVISDSDYILREVPPRSSTSNEIVSPNDRRNFEALCRGETLLPIEISSKLKCYYDDRGVPGFKLSPFKVEVNYGEPNVILTFHDAFSEKETSGIVDAARPKMNDASIGVEKTLSESRISTNAWIADGKSDMVDRVSEKIDRITGLRTFASLDREAKREEYEMLQVANYGLGGHYDCHHDPMFIYKEPDFIAMSVEETKNPYNTGDRMSTFMIYLTDVQRGGMTAFPRLGVATPPLRGSAVFWHNIKRSGRSDMLMLHGACPVVVGSKWVANKWVREVANIFRRPCVDNIDQ